MHGFDQITARMARLVAAEMEEITAACSKLNQVSEVNAFAEPSVFPWLSCINLWWDSLYEVSVFTEGDEQLGHCELAEPRYGRLTITA